MKKYKSLLVVNSITLIELISAISILSIIMVMGVSFIFSISNSSRFVKEQSQLAINSQLLLSRMEKELLQALPYSYRVTNTNRCLMFLPVVATGFYNQLLPDQSNGLPGTGNSVAISVSPHNVSEGNAVYMSVGVNDSSEVYGNVSDSLSTVQSRTAITVRLDSDHQWLRNSSRQRFYLTDNAKAFCFINSDVRYYTEISATASQVNLSSTYDLMGSSIESGSLSYDISSITNGCRSCVTLSFSMRSGETQLPVSASVSTRYVP
jgi:type II secretory pathway pseudopilin PulG